MRNTLALIAVVWLAAGGAGAQTEQLTSIAQYLPEDCPTDGSVDLTDAFAQAFAERCALYFPGSDDPAEPYVYAVRAPLEVRDGSVLVFGPNSVVRRLPSEGALLTLGRYCRISGCVIDGNKYEHWPEFQDLGKGDYGILCRGNCVIEDCFVYNNPGIAFGTWADNSRFVRCRAENVGYIDVKFGADYYQGAWDAWSGDGFYLRGRGNLVRECVAYDCFRWDLCASHEGARGNTFVDCRGGDVNWRTYGFVDIEGAEPDNRLIRCISPNARMAISTPYTQVIDCVAAGFVCYTADYLTMRGCTATSEGICLGSPGREGQEAGGASPIITGNRIFMPTPTARRSSYALYVRSEDGAGVVEGNIIYAFEAEDGTRGEAIETVGFEPGDNQVVYGQWEVADEFVPPRLLRGRVDWDHIGRHKLASFEEELAAALPGLGIEGEPAWRRIIIGEVPFALDREDAGVQAQWFLPDNRPSTRKLRVGWPWNKQIGDIYAPGWYFVDFEVPEEQAGRPAWVYFGGVDSEAVVWLNGERLGEHDVWNEPFSFEVTGRLVAGMNRLVVRAYTEGGLAGAYKPIAVVVK